MTTIAEIGGINLHTRNKMSFIQFSVVALVKTQLGPGQHQRTSLPRMRLICLNLLDKCSIVPYEGGRYS